MLVKLFEIRPLLKFKLLLLLTLAALGTDGFSPSVLGPASGKSTPSFEVTRECNEIAEEGAVGSSLGADGPWWTTCLGVLATSEPNAQPTQPMDAGVSLPAVEQVSLGMRESEVIRLLGRPSTQNLSLNSFGGIVEYGYGASGNDPRVQFLPGQVKSVQGRRFSIGTKPEIVAGQSIAALSFLGRPTASRIMADKGYRVDRFSGVNLTVFSRNELVIEFSISGPEECFQPIYLSPSELNSRKNAGRHWEPPRLPD